MFFNYQWLIIGVIIACCYLVISSTSIKEGVTNISSAPADESPCKGKPTGCYQMQADGSYVSARPDGPTGGWTAASCNDPRQLEGGKWCAAPSTPSPSVNSKCRVMFSGNWIGTSSPPQAWWNNTKGAFAPDQLWNVGDFGLGIGNYGGTITGPSEGKGGPAMMQVGIKALTAAGGYTPPEPPTGDINSILIDKNTTLIMTRPATPNYPAFTLTRTGPLLIWFGWVWWSMAAYPNKSSAVKPMPTGGPDDIWVKMGGTHGPPGTGTGSGTWNGYMDPMYTSQLPVGCKLELLPFFNAAALTFNWKICCTSSCYWDCTCTGGTAATGAACPSRGEYCAKCNAGYTLNTSNNTCVQNICVCPNGTPVTGAACTTNNVVKCSKCAIGFHIVGDSCEANPQCPSYTCPPGRQYKSNYKQIGCQTATCQDSECCDPIPQPTCSSFTCPKNSTLNKNPKSVTCAGKSCTDGECCAPNPKPTCFGDNMKCPTNFYLKSNGQKIQCANYSCTIPECCSANPICSSVTCGSGFTPAAASTICKGQTCTTAECCTPNPTCAAFSCDIGYTTKTGGSQNICAAANCTSAECCAIIPPSPPSPSPSPLSPSPPTIDEDIDIYFPGATFITFNKDKNQSGSPNSDIYNYSQYDGWTSPSPPKPYLRTNNMFSDTPLPGPIGIASFNNRSYNQA